jgi:hypothetical protein
MILLPLMTTWIWFQIFAASPLLCSGCPVADACDADVSLLPIPSII